MRTGDAPDADADVPLMSHTQDVQQYAQAGDRAKQSRSRCRVQNAAQTACVPEQKKRLPERRHAPAAPNVGRNRLRGNGAIRQRFSDEIVRIRRPHPLHGFFAENVQYAPRVQTRGERVSSAVGRWPQRRRAAVQDVRICGTRELQNRPQRIALQKRRVEDNETVRFVQTFFQTGIQCLTAIFVCVCIQYIRNPNVRHVCLPGCICAKLRFGQSAVPRHDDDPEC